MPALSRHNTFLTLPAPNASLLLSPVLREEALGVGPYFTMANYNH